jgi:hypothetical protein
VRSRGGAAEWSRAGHMRASHAYQAAAQKRKALEPVNQTVQLVSAAKHACRHTCASTDESAVSIMECTMDCGWITMSMLS